MTKIHDGRKAKTLKYQPVTVPAPAGIAPTWADRYPRELDQDTAAALTHYGKSSVRAWARDWRTIPPLALATLQAHLWGCSVPPAFRQRGIHFANGKLHTRNGYALDPHELDALAWTLCHYRDALRELRPDPAPPRRPLGWRQWLARHRAGLPTD